MAGTGIHLLAKLRSQIPRDATPGIAPWHTALKLHRGLPSLALKEYMRTPRSVAVRSQI
jgi:hypothetical protein